MTTSDPITNDPPSAWWERLVARLERWHGARRAIRHEIGTAYRASTIDIPASRPRYLAWIERAGRRIDDIWSQLFSARRAIALTALATIVLSGALYGMYWGGTTRQTNSVVVETRWLFHVSVRARLIRQASDWHDQLHEHAFDATCRQEVRGHHDCHPYLCPGIETYYVSGGRRGGGGFRTRVVIRTCYESCPDYDAYCRYSYPTWPTIANRDNGGIDHRPVCPDLGAAGNQFCIEDDEELHTRGFDQCETDTVTYSVQFDAPGVGHWSIVPTSQGEFDRYQTGDRWHSLFNHFGRFEPGTKVSDDRTSTGG